MVNQFGWNVSELTWANGHDDGSSANITAIAAPGANRRLLIKRYKVNVLTADTAQILSGTDEKDRHYLGATSGIDADFGNEPMILGNNEAFVFGKTSGTTMSWSCQYAIQNI